MKSASLIFVGALLLVALFNGCALSGETAQRDLRVSDVVVDLQMEGLTLIRSGIAPLRFFTTNGERYTIVGQADALHLFQYSSADQAAFDASRAHGGIDGIIYHRETVVVVYFGTDLNTQMMIASVMGPRVY